MIEYDERGIENTMTNNYQPAPHFPLGRLWDPDLFLQSHSYRKGRSLDYHFSLLRKKVPRLETIKPCVEKDYIAQVLG